jgi:hypothetical protein
MTMVNMFVNGIGISVPIGTTVFQACEKVGVQVSRFCYHEKLMVAGNCRMCMVEREGYPKPLVSCAMPVANGMKVYTETPRVKKAREGVMERLLRNHPLDCPICDQGGECDLQDQSMAYGSHRSRSVERKRGVEDKNFGPLVKTVMTRCIHCTRCVRFASEVAGRGDRGITGRGMQAEIGTYVEKKRLDTVLAGNRVDLCPVGALTSKPVAFRARSWERSAVDTVDVLDPNRTPVRRNLRGGEVIRVRPVAANAGGAFIGDKTRYARDGLYNNRRTQAYRYGEECTKEEAQRELKKRRSTQNGVKFVRGSSVDLQRVGKRVNLSKKGRVEVEGRGKDPVEDLRYHQGERGFVPTQEGGEVAESRSRVNTCVRRGVDLNKERPVRQTWRRTMVTSSIGQAKSTNEAVVAKADSYVMQWGTGSMGRAAKAIELGTTRSHLMKRYEGRHRRSKVRVNGESMRRVGETRGSRRHPRRVARMKQLHTVSPEIRVNRLNTKLNEVGRNALGLKSGEETNDAQSAAQSATHGSKSKKRIRVGVDEGERVENGRTTIRSLVEKKRGSLSCLMNSHAPTNDSETRSIGEEGLERRLPRKTGVEVDQRRTDRTGKAVWTVGVGSVPSTGMNPTRTNQFGEGEREEELSDSYSSKGGSSIYGKQREDMLQTAVVNTIEGTWEDRVRPDRYDYYREGHAINRASKVMAKCSLAATTSV